MPPSSKTSSVWTICEFEGNKKGVLHKKFLVESYKTGLLKDAHVFMALLGLRDNGFQLRKNKFNFDEWNITRYQWHLVMKFLKFGVVTAEKSTTRHDNMEELNEVLNVLGGIPSFDKYYQEFIKQELNKPSPYNPTRPEEDKHRVFNWVVASLFHRDKYSDWDIVSSTDKTCSYYWFRKERSVTS